MYYGYLTALLLVCYTDVMKIFSWNVNGIRAVEKKGEFEAFLKRFDPDIVCIQETKAQPEQVEEDFGSKYSEYQQFWYSAERKGYSGTAIFTKIEPIETIFGIPKELKETYQLDDTYGDTTKEGRVSTLEFDDFYISTVYTPNAKDDLSRIPMRQHWDPAYLEYMKQLNEVKPVIFCGDFNVAHAEIDLARPKENRGKKGFTDEERAGFDAMLEAGFVDTLRHLNPDVPDLYTWWSHWGGARERNVGWRIDYVMIPEVLLSVLKRANIHPDQMGSDHCPVSIDIAL